MTEGGGGPAGAAAAGGAAGCATAIAPTAPTPHAAIRPIHATLLICPSQRVGRHAAGAILTFVVLDIRPLTEGARTYIASPLVLGSPSPPPAAWPRQDGRWRNTLP